MDNEQITRDEPKNLLVQASVCRHCARVNICYYYQHQIAHAHAVIKCDEYVEA